MFYDNFMALCTAETVTPSAVMRAIGLNKSSASYWKKGSMPSTETLQKLADYFGVSVDYLLGKEDLHEDTESILNKAADEYGLSKMSQEFAEKFLKLDDPARSVLLGYAYRLVEERRNRPSEQDIPTDIDSLLDSYKCGLLVGIAIVQANYTLSPESIDIDSIPLTQELKELIDNALKKQRRIIEAKCKMANNPRYRAETAPQSSPAPSEGKDTTPPPDAPETAPEGE